MGEVDRGLRGLTEVAGLSDEQARIMVLGSWHKLNDVLMAGPELEDLQRLFFLELTAEAPRRQILRRLRAAVSRGHARASEMALERLVQDRRAGRPARFDDLELLGLTEAQACALLDKQGYSDAGKWPRSRRKKS